MPPETGWGPLNLAATFGAYLLGLGVLVFVYNVARSRRRGRLAGPNPWGAGTLEWATPSPTPSYGFLRPPTVRGDEPLWGDPDDTPVVVGLKTDAREVLVTTANEAFPDLRHTFPTDSIWPPLLALGVGGSFIGFVFHPAAFPIGVAIGLVVLTGWFWPRSDLRPDPSMTNPPPDTAAEGRPTLDVTGLSESALGPRHPGWWGNTLFIAIETTTVVLLVVSYFYTRRAYDEWPPPQSNLGSSAIDPRPGLGLATVDVLLLLASCLPAAWMHRAAKAKESAQTAWGLAAVVACGALAIVLRFGGLGALKFRWDDNAYGSLVWAIIVLHLTYLIAAVLEAAVTLLWILLYGVDEKKMLDVHLTTIYWYWMAGVWAVLYATVYWAPRIL